MEKLKRFKDKVERGSYYILIAITLFLMGSGLLRVAIATSGTSTFIGVLIFISGLITGKEVNKKRIKMLDKK